MANEGAKGKDETLIGIDQRMVNQKDPSQMVIEVMLPETIEGNKDVSNADKRAFQKGLHSRKCPYILRGRSRRKCKYEARSKTNNA